MYMTIHISNKMIIVSKSKYIDVYIAGNSVFSIIVHNLLTNLFVDFTSFPLFDSCGVNKKSLVCSIIFFIIFNEYHIYYMWHSYGAPASYCKCDCCGFEPLEE